MSPTPAACPITILMAEDSEDDRFLTLEAMKSSRVINDLRFVGDGVELLEYLRREGAYQAPESAPWPGIILLDINMPRMDGLTALAEIKRDPRLRRIPVVVLTTSDDEHDVLRSYDLGAASFITKPVTFASLVAIAQHLDGYWAGIVTLPPCDEV
jgi:CheY-like chemotaxis protein